LTARRRSQSAARTSWSAWTAVAEMRRALIIAAAMLAMALAL
jgi:hypothetical protein